MARFALKSALPLAFVLGFAVAVPGVAIAQAQQNDKARNLNDSTTNFQSQGRPLNDSTNQRNLNSTTDFQSQGRPLNDQNSARGTTATESSREQKDEKREMK